MKKHLLCIAALAAAGAASAQSSVTLYGSITLGAVKQSGQDVRLDAGNGYSTLGFKGSEDLGGGLKANFDLQMRYSPESGMNDGSSTGRPLFQGQTLVGLSGGFGAVNVGRGKTPLQSMIDTGTPFSSLYQASQDIIGDGYATDPRTAATSRGGLNVGDDAGAARTDHIAYNSPKFSGFSARLGYGLKHSAADGNTTVDAASVKNLTSLRLDYANGPVYVALGHERNRQEDKILALAGSYDFTVAKLWLQHGTVDRKALAGSKRKTTTYAVSVPYGAFTGMLGYGTFKTESTTPVKNNKLSLGAKYDLSKRTFVYTTYAETKNKSTNVKTKGADLGLSHSF